MNSFTNLRDSMSGISGKMDQLRRRFSQTDMQDENYDQVHSSASSSPNPSHPMAPSPGGQQQQITGMTSSGYGVQPQQPTSLMRDRPTMNLNLNSASPTTIAPSTQPTSGAPATSSSSQQSQQQKALPKTISAPSSPTKTYTPANIARSIFRQVSQSTTNLVQQTVAGVSGGTGREKGKLLLVIDDQNTDWSKYFRGRRIQNEWEVRVEQAEFTELNMAAFSDRGAVVDMEILRSGTKVVRSFRPDFVLIRQPIRDAGRDYRHFLLALMYGNVPSVNSLESLCTFLDKPIIFSHLIQLQQRLGKEKFPLIQQSFYPNYREMLTSQSFPVVIKIGHCHSGLGKTRVECHNDFQDVVSLVGSCGAYCTVEPFIDSKYDLHLQKIGPSYKAFVRKSISGTWKANIGSSMLEQIPLLEKHRMWLEECSRLFGGLDVFAIEVLVGKDGQEHIIGLNDSTTMGLLGEAQEEDRQMIAEIVFRKMDSDANRRRYSQTQTLPPPSQLQQQDARQQLPGGPQQGAPNVPNGYAGGAPPVRRESKEAVGLVNRDRDQSLPNYTPRPGMPPDRPGVAAGGFGREGSMSRDPPLRDPRDSNIREFSTSVRDARVDPMAREPGPSIARDANVPTGAPPRRDIDPRASSGASFQPPTLEKRQSQTGMQVGPNSAIPNRGPVLGPQHGPGVLPNRPLNAGETDDTMSNLKKTFAGIFGDM